MKRISFLQTPEWLAFQKATGKKVWSFDDGIIKANIIKHDVGFGKSYLYIPYGPTVQFGRIQGGMRNTGWHFIEFLLRTAREERAIFVKIEPLEDVVTEFLYLSGARLQKSSKVIQPQHTLVMDLRQSLDELRDKMHHKTRYNINLAEKKGLSLAMSDDIDTFWNLLRKTTEHDGFSAHPKSYYENLLKNFPSGNVQTRLFLVHQGQEAIAGAIMLTHGTTVYYLHGAMDRNFRATMAPYFMHWRLMQTYKEQGFEHYDFWGIDSRRWPGVTRFKMGFNGSAIEYPGAFDLPVSGLWYTAYKLAYHFR